MVIVINSLIGRFDWKDMKGLWLAASTARLQVSDYSQLSDYNSSEWLVKKKKKKAATAPITEQSTVTEASLFVLL